MDLIVSGLRLNGDDNLEIELMHPRAEILPAFTPGAHIDIRTPSGALRQYSLCGPLDDPLRYHICVRREVASRGGSCSLHDDLRLRAKIEASAPRNLFVLPQADGYVLVSAGIGITPVLSMARYLVAQGAKFQWHHFERSRSRIAFLRELTNGPLADHVTLHVSEEGHSFRYASLPWINTPYPAYVVMACGPNGFLDLLAARLTEGGWQDTQFQSERFAPVEALAQARSDSKGFDITLASSGQSFHVGTAQTIAEVLLRNGVAIELSCEQGMCGACLTGVLAGIPEHLDSVLSTAEKAANTQMTICCSRAKSEHLVLDL